MSVQELNDVAPSLVAAGKGLLAIDESNSTCDKRFAVAIPQTYEARCAYCELLVTTPRLEKCISGAILYDETIRQECEGGTPFVETLHRAGIVPAIKVDTGAKALANHPGEKITEGLDGLRARLEEYVQMGARLTSRSCIAANAGGCRAAMEQQEALVPS